MLMTLSQTLRTRNEIAFEVRCHRHGLASWCERLAADFSAAKGKLSQKFGPYAPGIAARVLDYGPGQTIYAQGDVSDTVLYLQHGSVKLSVMSPSGKEAIVGVLGAGDFCGEGALAGQLLRVATATTMTASLIRIIPTHQMIRLLHEQHALADRFIAHMLARNRRLEEDLSECPPERGSPGGERPDPNLRVVRWGVRIACFPEPAAAADAGIGSAQTPQSHTPSQTGSVR